MTNKIFELINMNNPTIKEKPKFDFYGVKRPPNTRGTIEISIDEANKLMYPKSTSKLTENEPPTK